MTLAILKSNRAMLTHRLFFLIATCITSICCFISNCNADGLQISPIRINLTAEKNIAVLTLTNATRKKIAVEADIYKWLQIKGKDHYKLTHKLFIAPPIATINPGENQLFRIAWLKPKTNLKQELAYRVYLQEIKSKHPNKKTTLQLALRLGVPIFIPATNGANNKAEDYAWRIKKLSAYQYRIALKNNSNHHLQITDVKLFAWRGTKALVNERMFSYILPGKSNSWIVETHAALPANLHLQAITDFGIKNQALSIAGVSHQNSA